MGAKRALLGFALEGLGISETKSGGLCLHASAHASPASSDYQWLPALVQPPEGLDTTVNPYTGDWSISSYALELSGSDRLRGLLLTEQRTPSGVLGGKLSVGQTLVPYDVSGLAGQVLWVGDEAIRLGTYSSGSGYTGSTRAYWSTAQQVHEAGSYIYLDATPTWEYRQVKMVEHDLDTGTETIRWQGLITDIYTSEDGSRVVVETQELLGALRDAELNLDARRWPASPTTANRNISIQGWSAQVVRGATTGAFQVGGEYLATGRQVDGTTLVIPIGSVGTAGLLGSVVTEDTLEAREVIEVCALSSFAGLDHPAHPIAICLALLTSTGSGTAGDYDILTQRWGLGLEILNLSQWETALEQTPDLVVDRLLLGWDGEAVDVLAEVQKLLRAFGYFITVTATGLLGLGRLRLLDIEDAATAQATTIYPDGPLQWLRALGSSAGEVVAVVGGLPWEDASTIVVREARRSRRRALLGDSRDYRLDLSMLDPSRVQVSGRESSALASTLGALLYLGLDAAPRLRVRVPDYQMSSTLTDLDLGAIVQIPDVEVAGGWLLDADGTVVTSGAAVRFYGMIVGRLWDARRHTYTLELLLLNYRVGDFARLRAPAAAVASWDAGSLHLELAPIDYGAGAAPTSAWREGDQVSLWTRDGTLVEAGLLVTSVVDDDVLELDAAPSTTPTTAHVLRVAASDVIDTEERYSGIVRPFAYAAPADGDFEDVEGATTKDVYGTNVLSTSGNDRTSGYEFIGLDEDAITATGDSAQPLDTCVEWTLLDQMSAIIEQGHSVSWTPQTGNAGDYDAFSGERPFASVSRSYAVLWPWWLQAGQTGVEVSAIVRNADPSGNGGTCAVEVQVGEAALGSPLSLRRGLSTSNTEADTPEFQPEQVTVSFDTIQAALVPTSVGITVESEADTTVIASTISGAPRARGQYEDTSGAGGFFTDTGAARPNVAGLDLQVITDGPEVADILYRVDDELVVVYPPVEGSFTTTERRSVPYAQLRGCQVRNLYRDTVRGDQGHRGGIPVLAETCTTHFVNTERHHMRLRPVWLGPKGHTSEEAGYPAGYVERAIRLAGDAAGTLALEANVFLDTVDPQLLVSFYALGIHYTESLPVGVVLESGEQTFHTTAPWRAWVQAQQLDDGDSDWGGPTVKAAAPATKATLPVVHRVPEQTLYPAVRMEQHYQADSSPYLYKEGQLYQADLPILQRFDLAAQVSHDPSSDEPCRVQLHLDLDSAELYAFGTDNDYTWAVPVDNDVANLVLAIYGVSIWEVPQ